MLTTVQSNQRKPHSIPHLLSRVFGCPLLIDPVKAEVIANVILARAELSRGQHQDIQQSQASYLSSDRQERKPYEVVNQIAIIDICGACVNRASGMDAWSGLTSYEQLNYEVSDAAGDPNIKAILLRFDSPGGEVHGVFDLADNIVKASIIKPVWASVDDQAYSAGYLLASACSKIYVTRTSGVGSIGVVAMRLDCTEMDSEMGVKFNFIYAGDRKVDNNPHVKFSDPAEAAIRTEIDRVYGMFCGFVSKQRGLSLQTVKDTQAGLISGPDAIKLKFADSLGTFPQAFQELNREVSRQTGGGMTSMAVNATSVLLAEETLAAAAVKPKEEDMPPEDIPPIPPPTPPPPPGDPEDPEDDPANDPEAPEEEGCRKKKSMGDLQAPPESTTLPFAQGPTAVVGGDGNQRKDDDLMSQTTDPGQGAPAAAAPNPTNPTIPAPVAAPAATDPPPQANLASMEFIVEMCAVAGMSLTDAQRLKALNLDETGVRRKLIEERTAASAAIPPTASHIAPDAAARPAGVTVRAEMFEKMMAEAQQASASVTGPKLTVHQHVAAMLKANPAAYDEYLRANPAQTTGTQV